MKEKVAVFPGSFDPLTLGHEDIVNRSLGLFDRIIIGIGNNAQKKYMFSLEQREQWIKNTFSNLQQVEVHSYAGLTVDFCNKVGAKYILRGLRTAADFEFEKAIAIMNSRISHGIESIFILSDPNYAAVSSSIVRDIIRNGGNVKQFVPDAIGKDLL